MLNFVTDYFCSDEVAHARALEMRRKNKERIHPKSPTELRRSLRGKVKIAFDKIVKESIADTRQKCWDLIDSL